MLALGISHVVPQQLSWEDTVLVPLSKVRSALPVVLSVDCQLDQSWAHHIKD